MRGSEASISVVKWSVVKCSGVLQCSDGLRNKVSNIIRRLMDNMKLLLICILRVISPQYFFIDVYVVLFLFNDVIYVFLLYDCMFMYGYPDWGFSVLFPQLYGKCQGDARKDGARPALFLIFVLLYVFFVLLYVFFCVDLCIFCVVLCIFLCWSMWCLFCDVPCIVCVYTQYNTGNLCVLNNCHRVATQLQLNKYIIS
jgi:hypothetical protein